MKHNLGETVWLMRSNEITSATVAGRQRTELEASSSTEYLLRFEDGLVRWFSSDEVHASKLSLLETL